MLFPLFRLPWLLIFYRSIPVFKPHKWITGHSRQWNCGSPLWILYFLDSSSAIMVAQAHHMKHDSFMIACKNLCAAPESIEMWADLQKTLKCARVDAPEFIWGHGNPKVGVEGSFQLHSWFSIPTIVVVRWLHLCPWELICWTYPRYSHWTLSVLLFFCAVLNSTLFLS